MLASDITILTPLPMEVPIYLYPGSPIAAIDQYENIC